MAPRTLLAIASALVCAWVVRRTSWYLAIDQLGYLTFARDLARGRVFHPWLLEYVVSELLPKAVPSDVLAQTYVHSGNVMFSRYAPGFPLILALTSRVFGEPAVHSVNAVAVALLLVAAYALARALLESEWLALAVALLVVLLPNDILLWSISPLRDVPAHLCALSGLALLASPRAARAGAGRALGCGLAIGYAASIRVDAVLYLVPALALGWRRWGRSLRPWGVAALGVALGVAPLLAYDWLATGNPFRPTQAMEVEGVVRRDDGAVPSVLALVPGLAREAHAADAATSAAPAAASTPEAGAAPAPSPAFARRYVQGGGLRLDHLPAVLPENLASIRAALGGVLAVCALVGIAASVRAPLLFTAAVPYCVVATLLFSCWVRADSRYLAGVLLLLTLLGIHGARALATLGGELVARGRRALGVAASLAVVAGCAFGAMHVPWAAPSALPFASLALLVGISAAAIAGAVASLPASRATLEIGVALGLAAVFTWRTVAGFGTRASFQAEQVARARATLAQTLPDEALVLTTDQIGRPADNINYYMADHRMAAIYLREIARWGQYPEFIATRALRLGFRVFLLLPPAEVDRLTRAWSGSVFRMEVVADVPADRAADVFVASPTHRGIALQLVRLRLPPTDPYYNPEW